MKLNPWIFAVFVGMVAITLTGQTKIKEGQVQAPFTPVTAPKVRVLTVDGWQNASPDNSIFITKVGSNYVISAAAGVSKITQKDDSFLFVIGQPTYTLSSSPATGSIVSVYRNGMIQKPGQDYNIIGSVITLTNPGEWSTDDSFFARYFI